MMKIGFQGDIGSHSEAATQAFVQNFNFSNVEQIPLIDSKNVVEALEKGQIDYGVMAIENSVVGKVKETKNALKKNIKMLAQIKLPIHHCLFTKSKNAQIDFVASHIQALKQTILTRRKLLPEAKEVVCVDTAMAAKMLYDGDYPQNYAVICRQNAGEYYGLYLYAKNIEDDPSNETTFGLFVLRK